MRSLLVLAAILGISLASEERFLNFAKRNGKKYATTEEFNKRKEIFSANLADLERHNKEYAAGRVTWWKKVTPWFDLTHEEWLAEMNLGMPAVDPALMHNTIDEAMEARIAESAAPASWSWKDQGAVTSVKDQQQCGSCAAFGAIAALDTCFYFASNVLYDDLSEQHLMDCAYGHNFYDDEGAWGAFGCDGAWPQAYYDWIVNKNGGRVEQEDCEPYTAQDHDCNDNDACNYMGAHMTGFYNKWYTNEDEMKELVYVAPVATTVFASYWGSYGGGVYEDSRCCDAVSDSNCIWTLNHEISVVGYGSEGGMDYWLVKNSWGKFWGEQGFMKIKRGTGHCGIGNQHIIQPYCAPN